MGLVKRAADLAYTFRFIRLMAMDWKSWDAYKLGIIDENGKRQRNVKLDNEVNSDLLRARSFLSKKKSVKKE